MKLALSGVFNNNFVRVLVVSVSVLFSICIYSVWKFTSSKAEMVLNIERKLIQVLDINRTQIKLYFRRLKKYPILESENIHFWDFKCNQYIWLRSWEGITNIASSPHAIQLRATAWVSRNEEFGIVKSSDEKKVLEMFSNPFTGKFDWLAEGDDGKLYSPDMPREKLLASPPIRVVNIRCPQTASSPPFFFDYSKW